MHARWLVLASLLGCGQPDAKEPPLRIPVTIETARGPATFQAELAADPETRARGLMHRTHLGEDEGMLFVFPREEQQSFWMKNTLIPLDMVFIRADRTILGVVVEAEPQTLSPRSVPGRSQYVLELRGGTAPRRGIEAGQTVRFLAPSAER